MRMSDWSSAGCSSDRRAYWRVRFGAEIRSRRARLAGESVRHRLDVCLPRLSLRQGVDQGLRFGKQIRFRQVQIERLAARLGRVERCVHINLDLVVLRSEEHTSELQSLMRISYAVLCLKKKKAI